MINSIMDVSTTIGKYVPWVTAFQYGWSLWLWKHNALSLILPVLLLVSSLYGCSLLAEIQKGEQFSRWRKNCASFRKLSPFVLPTSKDHIRSSTLDLVIVSICSMLTRITNIMVPIMLRRLVDKLADPTLTSLPIADIILFVLLRQVVKEALSSLFWTKLVRVEADISNRLMCHLFDKVLSLSADFHDGQQPLETYSTITQGGPRFARFAMSILFEKTSAVIDLLVAIVTFGRIFGASLAAVLLAIIIVYVWASAKLIPQRQSPFLAALRLRRDRDEMGGDVVRNWHTVVGFNNVDYERQRYRDATARARKGDGHMMVAQSLISAQRDVIMAVGFVVMAVLASAKIKADDPTGASSRRRSVGDFVMLLQYGGDLAYPIQNFVSWFGWFDEFFVESDKMIALMEAQPTVRDREDADEFVLTEGMVEFDRVGFSYDGQRRAVRDISFRVPGGRTVAIVGETGGGKSTLLRLLCRSYDVDEGAIRVDGQDVRTVRLASLMRHVSIVPQIIGLFDDSIEANLKYGRFEATQEDVERACETAAFHRKIMSFTHRYEEKVGEKGTKLSGGELQRLAIARALLRDSKIVLFDEAMSSLDSETEWRIQESLREFCRDKTVIIIAHRLATVAHADLILAVKDGVVVESGKQEALLAKKGYYYNLWDKQRLQ